MILETTGNKMDSEKLIKRFRIVILNTLANMSAPVANMVCSWLVIRWISPELWGSYTKIFLLLMLALQITGFGSKEFLLREFSKSPKDIFNHWFSSLRSRFFLVIGGIILFVFFPFENDLKITLICWLLVRFLYLSFDPILLFQKKIGITLLLESLALVFFGLLLWIRPENTGVLWLMNSFLLLDALKALVLSVYFSKEIKTALNGGYRMSFFTGAFPFFLLSISGMISSRADLYLVSFNLDKIQVAQYSVLLNFLIYLQALSNFIFQPFMKNFYRINRQATKRMITQFWGIGILVAMLGVPAILWGCAIFFHLEFNTVFLWIGILYVVPVYFYLPKIYYLYKIGKEKTVLNVNLAGIILNISLNILWLPSLGMTGALLAASLVQVLNVALYLFIEKKIIKNDLIKVS